jgi:hypothetical protein
VVLKYPWCGNGFDRCCVVLSGNKLLLGSFMSGNSLYSVLGIILVVAGIIILAFSNRPRKSVQDEGDSSPD